MFLQNERGLGVKNGTLGTIEDITTQSMTVRTDDGRDISFDLKDYDRIDHGYAATIHKSQGMTVDRTHVLATPGMDAHGSYVALSRHRDGMNLHYGRDDFASQDRLINTLSRDRSKDMASDYEQQIDPAQNYAERRGITFQAHDIEIERDRVLEHARDRIGDIIFDTRVPDQGAEGPERETAGRGITQEIEAVAHEAGIDPESAMRDARRLALLRHAQAVSRIYATEDDGRKVSREQWDELEGARRTFDELRPFGSKDAEEAYSRDANLSHEAASGKVNRAIRALQLETEIRTDPQRRADRFVERWQKLSLASERQYAAGDYSGYRSTRAWMGDMAKSLERDPQMESLLANRRRELGIPFNRGLGISGDLALTHGLGRGRGLDIGM